MKFRISHRFSAGVGQILYHLLLFNRKLWFWGSGYLHLCGKLSSSISTFSFSKGLGKDDMTYSPALLFLYFSVILIPSFGIVQMLRTTLKREGFTEMWSLLTVNYLCLPISPSLFPSLLFSISFRRLSFLNYILRLIKHLYWSNEETKAEEWRKDWWKERWNTDNETRRWKAFP